MLRTKNAQIIFFPLEIQTKALVKPLIEFLHRNVSFFGTFLDKIKMLSGSLEPKTDRQKLLKMLLQIFKLIMLQKTNWVSDMQDSFRNLKLVLSFSIKISSSMFIRNRTCQKLDISPIFNLNFLQIYATDSLLKGPFCQRLFWIEFSETSSSVSQLWKTSGNQIFFKNLFILFQMQTPTKPPVLNFLSKSQT